MNAAIMHDKQRMLTAIFGLLLDTSWSKLLALETLSLAVAIALWNRQPAAAVIAWYGATRLTTLWQICALLFARRSLRRGTTHRWVLPARISAVVTGLTWSALVWAFDLQDPFNWVALIVVTMIGFTGVHFLHPDWPSALGMTAAVFGPIGAHFVLSGTTEGLYLAGSFALTVSAIVHSAWHQHRNFVEALNMRFEQERMTAELSDKAAALEQANAAIQRANREKSLFFQSASHDLRQPVHALALSLDTVARRQAPPQSDLAITTMRAAVRSLDAMLADLMFIAKLEAGTSVPKRDCFAVEPILENLRREFLLQAQHRGLRFVVRPSDLHLHSDRQWLERILRNLVSNAMKFTFSGGVLIGCRRLNSDRLCRIQVWDTGIGIAPADRERVFEDFFQAESGKSAGADGVGLGLGIVRRLAMALKHPAGFRSRLGRGTVFEVSVPLAEQVAEADAPAQGPQSRDDLQPVRLDGIRVAVLDDEKLVVQAMEHALQAMGAHVVGAESAEDLMQRMAPWGAYGPDVLIVDYRLGFAAFGTDAVMQVRSAFRRAVPALVVSADPESLDARNAPLSGTTWALKPIPAISIAQWIQRAAVDPGSALPPNR